MSLAFPPREDDLRSQRFLQSNQTEREYPVETSGILHACLQEKEKKIRITHGKDIISHRLENESKESEDYVFDEIYLVFSRQFSQAST